jgi:hypothetical protein
MKELKWEPVPVQANASPRFLGGAKLGLAELTLVLPWFPSELPSASVGQELA